MKQICKRLCLISLCFLLVLPLFAGCADTDDKPSVDSTQASTATNPPATTGETVLPTPPAVEFSIDRLKEMKIVYPQGANETVILQAASLASAIQTAFGVEIPIGDDFIREGSEVYKELEYEILVGNTARSATLEMTDDLREQDLGYRAVGSKIWIFGGSDAVLMQAIADFTYNIVNLKKGGEGYFYKTELDAVTMGAYAVEELLLNGKEIRAFSIVYPQAGDAFAKSLAERLSIALRLRTGYSIPVQSDQKAANGAEILIGATTRSEAVSAEGLGGAIGGKGETVQLSGANSTSLANAVNALLEEIDAAAAANNKKAALSYAETQELQEDGKLAVMSFNVKTADMDDRVARVNEMILRYLPDLVGIQEANPNWMTRLKNAYSDYYTIIGIGREGEGAGEHTPIFVAKHRFEVLDSGTKWLSDTPDEISKLPEANYYRIFTYAKLKDLATGEIFLYINTHLDNSNDTVRLKELNVIFDFLKNYEQLPVLLMGDLNAVVNSTTIKTLKAIGFTSASDQTENKNATPTIDWILNTDDCFDALRFQVCKEQINGDYASDHHPVYAELTLKTPEDGVSYDWSEVPIVFPDGFAQPTPDTDGEDYGPVHPIH